MNEASFASLNPSLLARKGGAKPAMRPQLTPLHAQGTHVAANLEDLGWNDMGDDADELPAHHGQLLNLTPEPANELTKAESRAVDKASQDALVPVRPVVHLQQAELAERVAAPQPVPLAPVTSQASPRRSALARGRRAAFTLRLDEERHLKLRLLSTIKGASAQQIVTEALDALLDGMADIESLAAQVKRR
jgi:predicted DNA-binding protein